MWERRGEESEGERRGEESGGEGSSEDVKRAGHGGARGQRNGGKDPQGRDFTSRS